MATAPLTSAQAPAKPRAAFGIHGLWWKALTGLWMGLAVLATFLYVGPAPGFPNQEGARAIIFHVPCAELITLFYCVGAWFAIRTLIEIRTSPMVAADFDFKCAAAMELGLLFSILTTATGSIFSSMEWGAYWSWDPRQTSILVICLIFAAYVVLRGAVDDPERRARLCSAYTLVAIVPGLFLIWVLPRIVSFTLHSNANNTLVGGQLQGHYRQVMYGLAMPAFLALFVWLMQLRVRVFRLEAKRATLPVT